MPTPFLQRLAQPRPDPGGGAAAAHGGMLAVALLSKVARLEAQRPGNQPDRQVWEDKLAQIEQLSAHLERLREEDVRAYAQMTAVRASGSRGREWREAVAYALKVPQEIMTRAQKGLTLLAWVGERCRKHLVSDLKVAQEFLLAALQGAHQIALANLPLVAEAAARQDFSQGLSATLQAGRQAYGAAGDILAAR